MGAAYRSSFFNGVVFMKSSLSSSTLRTDLPGGSAPWGFHTPPSLESANQLLLDCRASHYQQYLKLRELIAQGTTNGAEFPWGWHALPSRTGPLRALNACFPDEAQRYASKDKPRD